MGQVVPCATSNDRRNSSATTTVLLTRSPKPSKCNLEPHEPSLSQRVVDKSQGTDVDVGLVVHEDCFGGCPIVFSRSLRACAACSDEPGSRASRAVESVTSV